MKVKLYPAMYEMAAKKGLVLPFMLYLYLRAVDTNGSGRVSRTAVIDFRHQYGKKYGINEVDVAYAVDAGMKVFFTAGGDQLFLSSLEKIAVYFTGRPKRGGHPVQVDLVADRLSVLHGRLFGAWVEYKRKLGEAQGLVEAARELDTSVAEIERLTVLWVWEKF